MWRIGELLDAIHELIEMAMKRSATRTTSCVGEAVERTLHHADDFVVAGGNERFIARRILATAGEAQRRKHAHRHVGKKRKVRCGDAHREPEREAHRDGENADTKSPGKRQPGCEGTTIGERDEARLNP